MREAQNKICNIMFQPTNINPIKWSLSFSGNNITQWCSDRSDFKRSDQQVTRQNVNRLRWVHSTAALSYNNTSYSDEIYCLCFTFLRHFLTAYKLNVSLGIHLNRWRRLAPLDPATQDIKMFSTFLSPLHCHKIIFTRLMIARGRGVFLYFISTRLEIKRMTESPWVLEKVVCSAPRTGSYGTSKNYHRIRFCFVVYPADTLHFYNSFANACIYYYRATHQTLLSLSQCIGEENIIIKAWMLIT